MKCVILKIRMFFIFWRETTIENNQFSKLEIKTFIYSDNQKTMEYEDDIIAMFKCIRGCYKAKSYTIRL